MYLVHRIDRDVTNAAQAKPPFGPGFDERLATRATSMEVLGTSFNDPGPDYCEFVLFEDGVEIARKRVEGY